MLFYGKGLKKSSSFAVDMNRFIFVLLAAAVAVAYTAYRFWQILPFNAFWKTACTTLHVLCFFLFFLRFMTGDRMPMPLAIATYELSTGWLIFFLYALILFAVLDLGRLVHLVPKTFLKDSCAGTSTVLGILTAVLVYGGLHYHHKYRQVIEIQTDKPLQKPLTLLLASDLHAGYHNRAKELGRWVNLINAEHPDLVLFAGDIVDGGLRPVWEGNYAEVFRQIEAPVYACLGNHEYIGGEKGSEEFLEAAGIRLLRDSSVVAEGIRIIGRDDRSNRERLELKDLVQADSLFTLVLDHQPHKLEEAEQAGVDFQFSGHTHHGQIWPGNWFTDLMFEKAYGPYEKGDTHYYITSGLGIWGGKFRIGTRSEYIVLRLSSRE